MHILPDKHFTVIFSSAGDIRHATDKIEHVPKMCTSFIFVLLYYMIVI